MPITAGSVAQLDRATAFYAVGRAFESRQNHIKKEFFRTPFSLTSLVEILQNIAANLHQ